MLSALDRLTLNLERIHSLLGDLREVYRRKTRTDSGVGWQPEESLSGSTGEAQPSGESREATGDQGDTRSAKGPGLLYGGGPSAFTRK